MVRATEGSSTLTTSVGPFPSVPPVVPLELIRPSKCPGAVFPRAAKWFLSGMDPMMSSELRHLTVPSLAKRELASEWAVGLITYIEGIDMESEWREFHVVTRPVTRVFCVRLSRLKTGFTCPQLGTERERRAGNFSVETVISAVSDFALTAGRHCLRHPPSRLFPSV